MPPSLSRWLVALALAALVPLGAPAGAAGALDEARSLVEEGRHGEALARVDAVLGGAPEDPQALFLKGVILVERSRRDEAIEVFSRLARAHPELPEPHNNLAVLHAAAGDYERARDALLLAINTHPSYATAHENLGDVYARMAALAYDEALRVDGSSPGARAKLALIDELFSTRLAEAPGATDGEGIAAAAPAPEPAAELAPELAAELPELAVAPVPASADRDAVLTTLVAWAQAWSRQDVEGYLGHYADGFDPAGEQGHAAWLRERRERVSAPAFIDVDLRDAEIEMTGAERAEITFTQSYRSDTYRDRVRKRVVMAWNGSRWRIVDERELREIR